MAHHPSPYLAELQERAVRVVAEVRPNYQLSVPR